jgi:hypothetical protein
VFPNPSCQLLSGTKKSSRSRLEFREPNKIPVLVSNSHLKGKSGTRFRKKERKKERERGRKRDRERKKERERDRERERKKKDCTSHGLNVMMNCGL